MNKGILFGIGIFIAVVVFGLIFTMSPKEKIIQVTSSPNPVSTEVDASLDSKVDSKETVKVIRVSGQDFSFNLSDAKLKRGEKIRIEFTNTGRMEHDFRIEELNIGTKIINKGENDVLEFTVPQSGELTYFCSVGTHRALGMEGKFIIEE